VRTLINLANCVRRQCDFDRDKEVSELALDLIDHHDGPKIVRQAVLRNLGQNSRVRRDYPAAREWYRQLLVEMVVCWGAKAVLLALDWKKALLFVIVPHFFAVFGITTVNYLQHDGCDEDDPFNQKVTLPAPFTDVERHQIEWTSYLTPQALIDLVASRSYCITSPTEVRTRTLDQVRELLATHPALVNTTGLALPYVTVGVRATLA